MKNKLIVWLVISAIIMLAFPWLATTFMRSDVGMAVCFLLFFAVNPVYSIFAGAFAGKSIRKRWSLPFLSAMLFLLGVWIFFEMGEPAFILYAAIYLGLGMIAMFVSNNISKKKLRKYKVVD